MSDSLDRFGRRAAQPMTRARALKLAGGAFMAPSAVLIDVEGRVASEVLVGAEAIRGRVRGPRLVHVE